MVKAIVGGNWGDEGKGKMTDLLAGEADIVIRFQGGANAGHTIINDYGKSVLHILPSGVFRKNTVNIIGQGAALDLDSFFKELQMLAEKGVPEPKVLVSQRAQIVMPYHILFDELEEKRLGKNSFGSTKSGIAPFYSDKYLKIGIQVSELFSEGLKEKIDRIYKVKKLYAEAIYGKRDMPDTEEIYNYLLYYKDKLITYVCDTTHFLFEAIKQNKNILLEGQLGALRDPDNGIYPFTTSSSPLAGYASVGAGIPPYLIKDIISVVKAYSTCVGAGAFVSEISGDEAEELRRRGGSDGEYGAKTGRPRRVGWFDAVATKYGCALQGSTEVALSMLDVLGYLDRIPVCTGYEIDGDIIDIFPITSKLEHAKPVYTYLDGWKCDIRGIKKYYDLPDGAKKYVEFIEEKIGFKITFISNGPERDEIIIKE